MIRLSNQADPFFFSLCLESVILFSYAMAHNCPSATALQLKEKKSFHIFENNLKSNRYLCINDTPKRR